MNVRSEDNNPFGNTKVIAFYDDQAESNNTDKRRKMCKELIDR